MKLLCKSDMIIDNCLVNKGEYYTIVSMDENKCTVDVNNMDLTLLISRRNSKGRYLTDPDFVLYDVFYTKDEERDLKLNTLIS